MLVQGMHVGMWSGGPGLMDPCEKQPVDAVPSLTVQQREDITHSAQVTNHTHSMILTLNVVAILEFVTVVF